MKKRIYFCLSVSLFVLFLAACESSKVEPDPSRLGYDYFPLETGRYAIFDVDETYYALTANPIVRTYQVKDEVGESFTDLTGDEAFKLFRYSRKDELASWQLDSVWIAKRTPNRAIRTENNVPFVKMVFPLEEQLTWNGNALNNKGEDDYRLEAIAKPYQLPSQAFDRTITVVQQADTLSIIGKEKRIEVYAQDVGLIYKELIKLEYCQSSVECRGQEQINFGVVFYHRLNRYGKN